MKQLRKGSGLLPALSSTDQLSAWALHGLPVCSLAVDIYPICFTVVPTETCPVGSSNTIIVNERNRELEKQEAWLLMELQKLRRQIEASEIRMVQRAPLGVDQGAVHDFSVRIKDLEVTVADSL